MFKQHIQIKARNASKFEKNRTKKKNRGGERIKIINIDYAHMRMLDFNWLC